MNQEKDDDIDIIDNYEHCYKTSFKQIVKVPKEIKQISGKFIFEFIKQLRDGKVCSDYKSFSEYYRLNVKSEKLFHMKKQIQNEGYVISLYNAAETQVIEVII